jgi:hypothetical protein
MSTVRSAGPGTCDDDENPGFWASLAMVSRLVGGWLCVAVGVLDLMVELDRRSGPADWPYLLFHVVLVMGGALLLGLTWLGPSPGTLGYLAAGAVAVGGMIIGTVPATTTMCCLPEFAVRHGFPFTFLARTTGDAQRWHVDGPYAVADLLFWGFAGLITLIVISVFRRPPRVPESAPDPAGHEDRQYIEHRARAEEQAEHRTVGPLP